LILASLANLTCALRWKAIVVELGQPLTSSSAIVLYFQGVTANTVLPGGLSAAMSGVRWGSLGSAWHASLPRNRYCLIGQAVFGLCLF